MNMFGQAGILCFFKQSYDLSDKINLIKNMYKVNKKESGLFKVHSKYTEGKQLMSF